MDLPQSHATLVERDRDVHVQVRIDPDRDAVVESVLGHADDGCLLRPTRW